MKLQNELNNIIEKFNKLDKNEVKKHVKNVKKDKKYKTLEVRIAWDLLRYVLSLDDKSITDFYKKYNCNDSHITTLAKKALFEVFGNINNW